MYHILYLIENLVNGKMYVGKHSTENLDDGYMGSGIAIRRAIEKYGQESFQKTILIVCSTEEEVLQCEKEIVDEEFASDSKTYNICIGGKGSWRGANVHEQSTDNKKKAGKIGGQNVWLNPENLKAQADRGGALFKKLWKEGKLKQCDWNGRKHRAEVKAKIGAANSVYQKGSGNSNHGKVWISNFNLKISKSVPKDELDLWIASGWAKGRKVKWNLEDLACEPNQ